MKKNYQFPQDTKGSRDFNAVVELDAEGYYVASVLELPGCHTQAKTLETLTKRLREAVEVYLEVQKEKPEPSKFVGVFRVSF